MRWSPQQDQALLAVKRWLEDPEAPQVFRLFGYAGTGKTTLARHFAEGVDGTVLFAAYTGKAAHVLHQKGCPGASTLHSLIYHAKDKGRAALKEMEARLGELLMELRAEAAPDEDFSNHSEVQRLKGLIQRERAELSRPAFQLNLDSPLAAAKALVIDECSMVDDPMGADTCSFKTKILVLGDPAQLPPVMGGGFFTENCEPDIMLTEIHRQAADNPIIAMATKVRLGETLEIGDYGSSCVMPRSKLTASIAMDADQLLVGKNATRHIYNARMRELLGFPGKLPVEGDRLVCLRNNKERGLLNGAIWMVDEVGVVEEERIFMGVRPEEGGAPISVEAHTHHFLAREKQLPFWERKEAEEFDFGYALTVHKSQGSQWEKVLLFDESWVFRQDRNRWLYTGLTRASDMVKVVRL